MFKAFASLNREAAKLRTQLEEFSKWRNCRCRSHNRHAREQNAVNEAKRLNIPIVAIVDTNADPEMIDYRFREMTMRFARFGSCCRNWSTRLFRQAAKPASENKSKWPAFPPNERLRRPLNSNSMKVMADIDPKLVKQLREKTNAGMMDCKRALAEAEG